MKGKLVTMAVSFLLCVGMVGAGFASWVITSQTKETGEGEIKVDTVIDKRIKIDSVDELGVNVSFGTPTSLPAFTDSEGKSRSPWLLHEQNEGETARLSEDLSSSITLTLNESNLLTLGENGVSKLKFVAKISITSNDAYNTAVTNKYIVAPTVTEKTDYVTFDTEGNASKTSVSFSFDFGWGEFFKIDSGNVNPYNYFNTLWTDGSDEELVPDGWTTAGDCANDVLTAISKIGEVKITITVVGTIE